MADLESIANRLSGLTVLEAAELSRMLEVKWGVSASAPSVQTVLSDVPTEPVVEQTEYTVILSAVAADKKINVIKEIRAITGLGLKEAKDFAESAGPSKILKADVSKDEATAMKTRIEEAGGTILIQ